MGYLWDQRARRVPLIIRWQSRIVGLLWVTLRVALSISTSVALVIGLPLGLALGLGRFRGRRTLQLLANASLALPSVVVGVAVLLLLLPQARSARCAGSSRSRAVYVAQTILALPFIVALTPAAIQGLPPGLIAQARAFGAGQAAAVGCSRCERQRSA